MNFVSLSSSGSAWPGQVRTCTRGSRLSSKTRSAWTYVGDPAEPDLDAGEPGAGLVARGREHMLPAGQVDGADGAGHQRGLRRRGDGRGGLAQVSGERGRARHQEGDQARPDQWAPEAGQGGPRYVPAFLNFTARSKSALLP